MRILYVEDDRRDADLTLRRLSRLAPQHLIHTVPTLREGVAALAEGGRFDLVLTDMHLPDGCGLELLGHVRGEGLPLPVVILTGAGDEEATVAALRGGADDYLVKQGNYLDALPAALEEALARFEKKTSRPRRLRVLYLEHSAADADLTRRHFERHAPHLQLETTGDAAGLLERFSASSPLPCDVLLLDYHMAGMNALELLRILFKERGVKLPIVIVTGHGDEEIAARALRLGAADYLTKGPGYLFRLPVALENAFHRFRLAREERALRHALDEAHAANNRLQAILTSLSSPLIATDAACRISLLNPAAEELFGVPPEKAIAQPLDFLLQEPALSTCIERFLKEEVPCTQQDLSLLHRARAEMRFFRLRLSVVRGTEGARAGLILLLTDVTREREIDRMKSEFIATAAHELRTPLTSVLGYAELLQQGEESGLFLPEQREEFLGHILEKGESLARIVDDLLDLGHMESGRPLQLERTPCDLRLLLEGAADHYRSTAPLHRIEVSTAADRILVHADRGRILQVLDNLLTNAVKYSPRGGVIRIEGTIEADEARIAVTDEGIGMSTEEVKRIFDKFYRADTSTTAVGGLGLGMSIARGIIEGHGGEIVVESEPGRGTRVTFTLPLFEEEGTVAGEEKSQTGAASPREETVPQGSASTETRPAPKGGTDRLVSVVQELSTARRLEDIMRIVRSAARELTGADGATFILRENETCYYAEEEAIKPVFIGMRFDIRECIGGWSMLNRSAVAIEDVSGDERIPYEAYRSSYIRSLAVVPIRPEDPIAAVATYWARRHRASAEELQLLQTLANATAVAMENVRVYAELEARVRERTAQLEAANRDLEAFSYSVSHDLRAPLRAIDGFSQILFERYWERLDEEGRKYLVYLREGAAQMDRLIRDLLAYSRLGRRGVRLAPVPLRPLLESLQGEMGKGFEEAEGSIELSGPLPTVLGDPTLLRQLFANLLQNAFSYRRTGVPPRVEIHCGTETASALIRVTDNGIGISPEHHERIFTMFQRLHSDEEIPGTGIGLAIVQRAAELLDGKVWVESSGEAGSTFCVRLPLAESPA